MPQTASALQTPNSETSTFEEVFVSPTMGRYLSPELGVRPRKLNVLIAEDNPVNSRLLGTRLTKRGCNVRVNVDGQACADTFKRSPDAFGVISMDLQMRLIDSKGSTRLTHAFEKETYPLISDQAFSYGQIPVIAVSASLTEQS